MFQKKRIDFAQLLTVAYSSTEKKFYKRFSHEIKIERERKRNKKLTLGGRIPPLKSIKPLASFVRNLKEIFPDFLAFQGGRICKEVESIKYFILWMLPIYSFDVQIFFFSFFLKLKAMITKSSFSSAKLKKKKLRKTNINLR